MVGALLGHFHHHHHLHLHNNNNRLHLHNTCHYHHTEQRQRQQFITSRYIGRFSPIGLLLRGFHSFLPNPDNTENTTKVHTDHQRQNRRAEEFEMAELRRCKSILFALFLVVFTALEYGAEGRTVFSSRIRDKRDLNAIQAQLIKVLNPRPVVDSIVSQKEKFGNFGEHPLGRKFVESFAALSNKVNLILAVPAQKLESVSKGTTEFLNMIGARLVGLQKK